MSHLFAAHSGVLGVRPKITSSILCLVHGLVHFGEALSSGGLNVSQGCDLTPAQFLRQTPFKFFSMRAKFLLN